MELSWGKCTIKIGKLQSSGEAPSSWIDIPTPVENSTKLTPTKGAKKEAKIEGGENEAVKYAANTYTFEFEIRAGKGRRKPVEDTDGVITGEYAVKCWHFSELRAMIAQIYTSIHILPASCRGLCARFRAVRRLSCDCRLPASRRV